MLWATVCLLTHRQVCSSRDLLECFRGHSCWSYNMLMNQVAECLPAIAPDKLPNTCPTQPYH